MSALKLYKCGPYGPHGDPLYVVAKSQRDAERFIAQAQIPADVDGIDPAFEEHEIRAGLIVTDDERIFPGVEYSGRRQND